MTATSFESALYQHLTPFFARYQFIFLPEKKQYRKTTTTGFQNVLFSPVFYDQEIVLDINFGCRNEQVEQIAQQFITQQALTNPDANTLLVSPSQFSECESVRFCIHSESDFQTVCGQIEGFFTTTGFDFLLTSGALPALDRLLNKHPGQPCPYLYNQMHRCYKGLITARLNHNTCFDSLIDTYRQLLVHQTQNFYEQIRFERLIAFLLHYSAN